MFQSTHPRKVRRLYQGWLHNNKLFQSTHPRKVRPKGKRLASQDVGFNPRTHVRCDSIAPYGSILGRWFQSTHPRKVRPPSNVGVSIVSLFQSTHPRKVRLQEVVSNSATTDVSIHAPT